MDWEYIGKVLPLFEKAAWLTVRTGVAGILLATLTGLLCAAVIHWKVPVLRRLAAAYVEISRNTPLLVQLFFIYYGLPKIGIRTNPAACGIFGLAFLGGGYMTEAFRSGIEAVDRIQEESALSLGLTRFQSFRHVILPQAAAIDLDVIFFGVDGMDGILEKIGEDNIALTEGVMLLTPFAADSQDEKVVNFVTKYKAAYNMTPDQFAADGYDAIYIIKAAIEQAGITEIGDGFNEALVAAMTQITVEGVTGSMQWTADGEPAKNATAVVIKDGVYVAFE